MKRLLRPLLLGIWIVALTLRAFADAGVLIPSSETDQPDPRILSLADMQVSILVDNQTAKVSVRQVFSSHIVKVLEGQYLFAIHPEALISDFAVWDGPVRIPGVILERKRAENVYNALRLQAIDPGLLQQAEEGEEGGGRVSFFSAKIVPIPAFGTKRLELEYTEQLPVERAQSYFYFPFKPRQFQNQAAGHLRIDLIVRSAFPLSNFKQTSSGFPLTLEVQTPHEIKGHFEGNQVNFQDDLAFTYQVNSASDLSVLCYRSTSDSSREAIKPITAFELPAQSSPNEPGYFQASAFFNLRGSVGSPSASSPSTGGNAGPGSNFIFLFDTSLSIRWDKLERQYEALEKILYQLRPQDRFQLLLFNSRVTPFGTAPTNATRDNIQAALEFLKKSSLSGGTDLKLALTSAIDQADKIFQGPVRSVLLSDGNPTLGSLVSKKILSWFSAANQSPNGSARLKLHAYGIGNDCNKVLLRELAAGSGGIFEYVGETEDAGFKLAGFASHLTLDPIGNLQLKTSPAAAFQQVYRSPDNALFDQAMTHWVGRYKAPAKQVNFTASGTLAGKTVEFQKSVDLPSESREHPFIPRNWAKARVDFLLRKIELEGEDSDSIREIIELSRKFKFVTPYTSFLAAPRSLLRPRLIKPGDPVLRVYADPDIQSILAIFPFGLTKPLRFLPSEKVWQTRFLAPKEMVDGVYACRLLLRDKAGQVYEEKKNFVIDSRAPNLEASVDRPTYRPGDTVQLRVRSDADTRRIKARLGNLEPVQAQWDPQSKVNIGFIALPSDLTTGQYAIEIFAEDFAHNASSAQVMVTVAR